MFFHILLYHFTNCFFWNRLCLSR